MRAVHRSIYFKFVYTIKENITKLSEFVQFLLGTGVHPIKLA